MHGGLGQRQRVCHVVKVSVREVEVVLGESAVRWYCETMCGKEPWKERVCFDLRSWRLGWLVWPELQLGDASFWVNWLWL